MVGSPLKRRFKAARDRARKNDSSIPELRWHDLRHTFGSLCAAGGVNVVSIQNWTGHSNLRTTMRYMHHQPSSQDAARLSRVFEGTVVRAEEDPPVARAEAA
jgi:integrase